MTEKYYDEVIAPKLAALCKECEDAGMPFLATVEYDEGKTGSTVWMWSDGCVAMRMEWMCARSCGNLDNFVMSCANSPMARGHNSIVLGLMGVKP